jgi:hypothetical protein
MVDAARPGGRIAFDGATLSHNTVTFDGATSSGGTVDLSAPAIYDVPPTFEDWTCPVLTDIRDLWA